MTGQPLKGKSKAMERLRLSIHKAAAAARTTVLIQGETGTGKELVARAIHDESPRAKGPFIALNCGNMPETLVESELFGHEKGAFTGADKAVKGKFEQADRGTLFLDEIGEISQTAQVKLLRVIQEHEIDRLGGQGTIKIDFRLIAATNRDLKKMAGEGRFREDLFYRLNVVSVRTPALRERLEDIPELAHHFALLYGPDAGRDVQGISLEVLDLFQNFPWQGNIRELENIIQGAIHNGSGPMIVKRDLPEGYFRKTELGTVQPQSYRDAINDRSSELCRWALEGAKGNQRKAARLLGLNRTSFRRIVKQHGLDDLLES